MYFLQNEFQMTVIALVSVINHYYINGLHQFWDNLYTYPTNQPNKQTHAHTHTHIYIYVYANFIKHNRYFMSTYFPFGSVRIPVLLLSSSGGELIYVLSIVACIPSTFCPTLGHHQGKIYYKSDVTFVLAYYYCVRASLPLKVMAFVF